MNPTALLDLALPDPDATTRFGAAMGACLRKGDTLLLDGNIGAGKTHFARALIQSLQTRPEDVPSPTFTILQSYETRLGEVLHADLYRLSGAGDLDELGLFEALGTQLCLIEWPDRLGPDRPSDALTVTFRQVEGGRSRGVRLSSEAPAAWRNRLGGLDA